ncbi:GD24327 [Drosophila simulans]|uniref:GD24327 n=1 Tax=Drosophila simulans TaxID=7240 RepID=B4Q4E9_DROSI|nr:GD24327 [Drosophila simulans]
MPTEEIPKELDLCDDQENVERDVRNPLVDSIVDEIVERDFRNPLVDSNVDENVERDVRNPLVDSNVDEKFERDVRNPLVDSNVDKNVERDVRNPLVDANLNSRFKLLKRNLDETERELQKEKTQKRKYYTSADNTKLWKYAQNNEDDLSSGTNDDEQDGRV